MKKIIALVIVFVFVAGCVAAFAEEATTSTTDTTQKGGFFRDMQRLFEKQIPETPNQKSQTHTIWKQTPGRGSEESAAK